MCASSHAADNLALMKGPEKVPSQQKCWPPRMWAHEDTFSEEAQNPMETKMGKRKREERASGYGMR
jgi:hypothetical protein